MQKLKIFLLAIFIAAGFFGFGGLHKAKAVQCSVDFNFNVTPTEVGLNGNITVSGWVRSKDYNSQSSSSGAGYCNVGLLGGMVTNMVVIVSDNYDLLKGMTEPSLNPLTNIQTAISAQTTRITKSFQISLNRYDNTSQLSFGPWSVNPAADNIRLGTLIPGYGPGESFTLYARVIAVPATGLSEVLSEASPVTVNMKNQTYACLTANSSGQYVYACSPGGKSNLSDVPNNACSGKTAQVVDMDKCGSGAPIYACVATDNKYACSPSNKSDCSDTTGCNTENKAKCQQVSSDKCNTSAGSSAVTPGAGAVSAGGGDTSSGDCTDPNKCLYNPLPTDALTDMLLLIMQGFLMIVGIWSVAFVIVGGFKYVMSQGNEEAVTAARKTITWAILGLVIALMSFSIIAIVKNIFKVETKKIGISQQDQRKL
ncbi:MAG: pilin [Candidatus Doudnabacteria bacterium]|nr:pilin [Candidatus Doudnabacteria bacterium]